MLIFFIIIIIIIFIIIAIIIIIIIIAGPNHARAVVQVPAKGTSNFLKSKNFFKNALFLKYNVIVLGWEYDVPPVLEQ